MSTKPPFTNAEGFVDEMNTRATILRTVEPQRRKEAENFLVSIGLGEGKPFAKRRLLVDQENSTVTDEEACILFKSDDSVAVLHNGRWQVGVLE